ncbi:MAG: acetyltransferase [Chitinophagales bacterium]
MSDNMPLSLIIVGNTSNARLAKFYFERDTTFKVVAFAVDAAYIKEESFEGKPVVALENLRENYPPQQYSIFVAIGYSQMNQLRAQKYLQCKAWGYGFASYISPRCHFLSQFPCGENCFILEDNTIQPYAKIGNNVVLWSGNHIGHDTRIDDHCFITSHVVVAGFTHIEAYCFIGVNATLRDDITIGEKSLIGAGAVVVQNTVPESVIVPPASIQLKRKSSEVKI